MLRELLSGKTRSFSPKVPMKLFASRLENSRTYNKLSKREFSLFRTNQLEMNLRLPSVWDTMAGCQNPPRVEQGTCAMVAKLWKTFTHSNLSGYSEFRITSATMWRRKLSDWCNTYCPRPFAALIGGNRISDWDSFVYQTIRNIFFSSCSFQVVSCTYEIASCPNKMRELPDSIFPSYGFSDSFILRRKIFSKIGTLPQVTFGSSRASSSWVQFDSSLDRSGCNFICAGISEVFLYAACCSHKTPGKSRRIAIK